jgi:hypothetical protein
LFSTTITGVVELCQTALYNFEIKKEKTVDDHDKEKREISKWASRLLGRMNDFVAREQSQKEKKEGSKDGAGDEECNNHEEGASSVLENDAWEEILAMSVATDRTTSSYTSILNHEHNNNDDASTSSSEQQQQQQASLESTATAAAAATTTTTTTTTYSDTTSTDTSTTARRVKKKKSTISAFTCPITCRIFDDPVTTADGMTYERTAIERWLNEHDTSPLTGIVLPHKYLTTNYALRSAIEDWKVVQEEEEKRDRENSRNGSSCNPLNGDSEDDGDDGDDEYDARMNEDTRTTRLDFMNRRNTDTHVYWYDPYYAVQNKSSNEMESQGMIYYATLRPNENWCVDTSIGHQWVAYDHDHQNEIGRWIASRSLPLVVFLPNLNSKGKGSDGNGCTREEKDKRAL